MLFTDRLNRTLREVAKQMVQALDAENRCLGPSWEMEKCENKECDCKMVRKLVYIDRQ